MNEQYDIIIVGGGIAGSGLGTALARGGKSVLVLEKSLEFRDMVRGEWIAPWGVVEARRIGIYDDLLTANDHHIARHIEYGDGLDPAEGDARGLALAMLPGVPGPLSLGHPQACQALFGAAVGAGATAVRGVEEIEVTAGPAPAVSYTVDGERRTAHARLVVGADGRGSVVRRQVGAELYQDPTHHYFAGLLVEDADDWPTDVQSMGTEGDLQYFVFPQSPGKARLYLGFPTEQKSRFAGHDAAQRFLDAFQFASVPNSGCIAAGRAAGPCHAIPNQSTWVDNPVAPGAVLLGDAAGYNDPIIGQGLASTLRDVRLVGELLLGSDRWETGLFEPYVEERRERMRRLRLVAAIDSVVHAEFGPEATARKLRVLRNPELTMPRGAVMVGPELLPAECFTEGVLQAVREA